MPDCMLVTYGPCVVIKNVSLFIYFWQILINKFFFRKKEKEYSKGGDNAWHSVAAECDKLVAK